MVEGLKHLSVINNYLITPVSELTEDSVIPCFMIISADRPVQDRLYESDFDPMLKQLDPASGSNGNE